MIRTKIKSTIYNLGNNSKCTQGRDSCIGVLFQTRNCMDRQTDYYMPSFGGIKTKVTPQNDRLLL